MGVIVKTSKRPGMSLQNYFDEHLVPPFPGWWIGVSLNVRKTLDNKYIEKQPCDFCFRTKKSTWWIDTKETALSSWHPLKKAPAHQVESLRFFQQCGDRAGFVVWFTAEDPARVNLRFIEDFDHPATIESGVRWSWDLLS